MKSMRNTLRSLNACVLTPLLQAHFVSEDSSAAGRKHYRVIHFGRLISRKEAVPDGSTQ